MARITIGDTSYSACKSGGDTKSITLSHDVAATSNILIAIAHISQDSARNYTMTWNGDAMTKLSDAPTSAENQVEMFYILNPDTGTHNIVATSGSESSNVIISSIDAFVPRGCPLMNSDNATGTTDPTDTVSTLGMAEALVVAGVCHGTDSARSPSDSQTEFVDASMAVGGTDARAVAGYIITSRVSSQTMGWTGDNNYWSQITFAVGYKNGGGLILLHL